MWEKETTGNSSLLTCTSQNYRVQERQASATPHFYSSCLVGGKIIFLKFMLATLWKFLAPWNVYNTFVVDRFQWIAEHFRNGRMGLAGVRPKILVGLCMCGPKIETLFQNKICDFRPKQKIENLSQISKISTQL